MTKRVAFISVPYAGHISVLIPEWERITTSSHLFLLYFSDEENLIDSAKFQSSPNVTRLETHIARPSENAREFNAARAALLQDALQCALHEYAPTLIVYDFFCIEAHRAARLLGIPAVCSVPALLRPDDVDTCSDGVLPDEHDYWVWKHPHGVAPQLRDRIHWMGPRRMKLQVVPPCIIKSAKATVIVCLGTVVPRYQGCQERYRRFMQELFKLARHWPDTKFCCLLNNDDANKADHAENVFFCGYVDLPSVFCATRPSLFIFHGGGNSYTEALHYGVDRMLVVPFFGDQFETARVVGHSYIDGDLCEAAEAALAGVPLPRVDTFKLSTPMAMRTFPDMFKPGDLVFGQRKNRDALQAAFPELDLHLNHYAPFETFAADLLTNLPAIADVYNDAYNAEGNLKSPLPKDKAQDTPYQQRLRHVDSYFERKAIRESMLVHRCLDILESTVHTWGGRIHFVLGANSGIATDIELEYLEDNWFRLGHAVLFFNTRGERVPAPWSCRAKGVRWPGSDEPTNHLDIQLVATGQVDGRKKSYESILDKKNSRRLPVLDMIGYRTGYIDQRNLSELQTRLPADWDVHRVWGDGRIHYYYWLQKQTEIQLWPWLYLHNFIRDTRDGQLTCRQRQKLIQDEIEKVDQKSTQKNK